MIYYVSNEATCKTRGIITSCEFIIIRGAALLIGPSYHYTDFWPCQTKASKTLFSHLYESKLRKLCRNEQCEKNWITFLNGPAHQAACWQITWPDCVTLNVEADCFIQSSFCDNHNDKELPILLVRVFFSVLIERGCNRTQRNTYIEDRKEGMNHFSH